MRCESKSAARITLVFSFASLSSPLSNFGGACGSHFSPLPSLAGMSVTIWNQLALCRGTGELFLNRQRHPDGGSAHHLTRPCHFKKFQRDFFPSTLVLISKPFELYLRSRCLNFVMSLDPNSWCVTLIELNTQTYTVVTGTLTH